MSAVQEWARRCGGEPVNRVAFRMPGPGHGPRDRSLSVKLSGHSPDGFVVFSFAGDDPIVCRDHVRTLIGLPSFGGPRREPLPVHLAARKNEPTTDNGDVATRLWSSARPIAGTLGERYLRDVRGIRCALPSTLRFLPASGERLAAVLTAFSLPREVGPESMTMDGVVVRAVHITRLNPDGTKSEKRMLGSPAGLPLVVAPFREDGRGLVIAEGIEDALSAFQATGLAAWAGGSGPHMAQLAPVIPTHAESVVIVQDDNDTGRGATRILADALDARGVEVVIWGGARG